MTQNRKNALKIEQINPGEGAAAADDIPFPEPPESGSWITDYAWISGLAGALMVVVCGFFFNRTQALDNGVRLLGVQLTRTREDSALFALLVITVSMLLTEGVRLWLRDRKGFIQWSPELRAGRYLVFLRESVINWLLYLCLLGLALLFFWTAGEYGHLNGHPFYQIWFRFLELASIAYLVGGLPYVLITRALKHDPVSDRRDFSSLMARLLRYAASMIPGLKRLRFRFNEVDRKAARALLVKLFFTPLMTVYFLDQFPHLVQNIGYVYFGGGLPESIANGSYTHARFNTDLINISFALIFSIDVALAWCGYVVSSRWVNNQTITAEPTMLGWLVCLFCYPPFNTIPGLYYSSPNEKIVFQLQNETVVSVLIVLSALSSIIYMSATLWFGVRFSNVTNRGIIRKGPFAYVRHPAYASKNFLWWCMIFPFLIYTAPQTGWKFTFLSIAGLVLITWIYYLRAITEERHLSADPYYRAYCEQVKYRFIPGVI